MIFPPKKIYFYLFNIVLHKIIWLAEWVESQGCAKKLFQDDQEAQLVQNNNWFSWLGD